MENERSDTYSHKFGEEKEFHKKMTTYASNSKQYDPF